MDFDRPNDHADGGETASGKLVYIASPYSGDVERNVEFARAACLYCIEQNNTPLAVHLLYPQLLDDTIPEQRQTGLRLGRHILTICDEMWVCGSVISHGMRAEIAEAERLGIPVKQVSAERILSTPVTAHTINMI